MLKDVRLILMTGVVSTLTGYLMLECTNLAMKISIITASVIFNHIRRYRNNQGFYHQDKYFRTLSEVVAVEYVCCYRQILQIFVVATITATAITVAVTAAVAAAVAIFH